MKAKRKHDEERLEILRSLVSAYEGALLRYVARLTGNASAAEDIVQNTFIKLIRDWKKVIPRFPSLSAWLYRVAHNEAIDHMRRETRRARLHNEYGEGCGAAMSAPSQGEEPLPERAVNAASALARLSERERQLVIFKVYEEKSYREIAQITGLSIGNIGYILHGAMKKLAQTLSEGEDV